MSLTSFSLLVATLAPMVAAHGWVPGVNIAGKFHGGLAPGQNRDFETPIRQIASSFPINGAQKRDMNCGINAQVENYSAPANPGDRLEFFWTSNAEKWPHDTGPMITYMTPCGAAGCQNFDPIDAEWFKIDEQGRDFEANDGSWVQRRVFNGAPAVLNLPTNLPAGEYLVRHEIIGLHLAQNFQGAEFYPSCLAIDLSGPADSRVSSIPNGNGETIRFPSPNGYTDQHPGIQLNPFDASVPYPFPGPAVINFADRSLSSAQPSSPPAAAPSQEAPVFCQQPPKKKRAAEPAVAEQAVERRSGGLHEGVAEHYRARRQPIPAQFAQKMPTKRAAPQVAVEYRPRQLSRVMKALV